MLKSVIKFIKPLIPIKRRAVHNGVTVPREVAPPYRLVHDYPMLPFVTVPDYPNSEGGEVNAHKEYTENGDTVVIVGGGRGVSTVNAARESGPTGNVIVFEGSEEYSNIIDKVTRYNNVDELVKISQNVVGHDKNIYGRLNNYDFISPEELPECDVLEMDCEGAEEEIVQNLIILPRVITVEIHPRNSDNEQTLESISDLGYNIEAYWTNEGQKISEKEFDEIIEQRIENSVGAPLITAIKD
jgi:hypothetical protein